MRLTNLNIGIKLDNTVEVVEFLKSTRADIITLQEVMREADDNVFTRYRSRTGIKAAIGKSYPNSFFGPLWITDHFQQCGERYRDFGGMVEQGNEILSSLPISNATNRFYYGDYSCFCDNTNWKETDHGRAVQVAKLDVDGLQLQIINVHGIWTADKRGDARTLHECQYIADIATAQELPTIIVGDFNLLPDSDGIQLLNNHFRNLIQESGIKTTRPAFKDNVDSGDVAVDYVFINGKIDLIDFQVVATDISDHLPLILDFEIREK